MLRKVLLILFGILSGLIGLGLVAGGLVLISIVGSDGWIRSGDDRVQTATYALVSEPQELAEEGEDINFFGDIELEMTAEPSGSEDRIFIGVGPTDSVEHYLEGVEVDIVVDVDYPPLDFETQRVDGSDRPLPPERQEFWTDFVSGTGTQRLEFDIPAGSFRVVVMNASGAKGVDVDASLGVKAPFVREAGIVLVVVAVFFLGLGIFLLVMGARTRVEPAAPPGGEQPMTSPPPPPPPATGTAQGVPEAGPAGEEAPPPPGEPGSS